MQLKVQSLADLEKLRSAPSLDKKQREVLLAELVSLMDKADWFTIGIMAPSSQIALDSLKGMEKFFNWQKLVIKSKPNKEDDPVFLKANQNTGDIHLRTEFNLGEGILISCQHFNEGKDSITLGPLPLDFFKSEIS